MAGYTRRVNSASPEDINVLDLFAGCGGLTAGFLGFRPDGLQKSPFKSVGAVEWDHAAAATYTVNHAPDSPNHVFAGDIKEWDVGLLDGADVDVILGGPPCQGFSSLNWKGVGAERNDLWREYIRVVEKLQPKVFVMENVAQFFSSPEFKQLSKEAEPGGKLENYRLTGEVLVAADYGVPQVRRRAILIATRTGVPRITHPPVTHRDPRKPEQLGPCPLQPWRTVREIFSRTAGERMRADLPELHAWRNPASGDTFPGPFGMVDLHIRRNPKAISLARYKAIPPGGNRYDLTGKWDEVEGRQAYLSTPSWDGHKSGSGDVMGRMYVDRPSVTIRTEFYKPEKGRYLHPRDDRPITHWEAALIQGFPDDYRWCGTKVQIARQIGNAVPLGLGEALARAVHEGLSGTV